MDCTDCAPAPGECVDCEDATLSAAAPRLAADYEAERAENKRLATERDNALHNLALAEEKIGRIYAASLSEYHARSVMNLIQDLMGEDWKRRWWDAHREEAEGE